ncbi:MAG: hypothetical protein ABJN34_03575 [Litoreibacter sp.]|uniref:hypothetical protein n=1 Tax=Litoreibacter sp. TaxID=1969459 RepID=UPI0032987D5F
MWQLQPILEWVATTQGSNLTLAVLCLLAICGGPKRVVMAVTLVVHLCLAFM